MSRVVIESSTAKLDFNNKQHLKSYLRRKNAELQTSFETLRLLISDCDSEREWSKRHYRIRLLKDFMVNTLDPQFAHHQELLKGFDLIEKTPTWLSSR